MIESSTNQNTLHNNQDSNAITISDILRVLRKNWILMLIIVAFIFTAGVIYTYGIVKPTYKATSTVSVEVPPSSEKVSVSEAGNSVTASLRYVQSIAEFVKSETIMKAVSEKPEYKEITTYSKLRSSTSVSYETTSIIISITVTDESRDNAKKLALGIAEELERYSSTSTDTDIKPFLCTIVVRDRALYSAYAAPNKQLYLIVSALGGLVLALVVVFIKEFASSKFQTPEEIRTLGYPILNTLVNDKSKDKQDAKSLMDPTIKNFEPYNRLISNIKFANVDNPYKVLMFTSTIMGELKTTVCSNFSLTLAHNEKKVVILDLDTRKPRIHKTFNVAKENGVVEYLAGSITKAELIKSTEYGVDIITVGKDVANPVTLLESKKLLDLINELKNDYDYVVIDTPPLTACNDAAIISKLADGVVYNVAINQGKKKEIKTAISQLGEANANIIGINITKANVRDRGGYYYYYQDKDDSTNNK